MRKKPSSTSRRGHHPSATPSPSGRGVQEKLAQAVKLHQEGQADQAGRIYREILAVEPDNPDALHLSGLLALERQDFDAAQELIAQAISRSPSMPSFHLNLGRVHERRGELPAAKDCYLEAIRLQPDSPDAQVHLGNLYRLLHQETEAIHCYRQVLRDHPHHAVAWNNLGNSLTAIGHYDEALECYRQAQKSDPALAEAYNNMGNTYKEMNRPQEAVACYQQALAVRPNYADPLNNIGYILQLQGKLSMALHFLQQALEIKPQESGILHNLGNVYKDMGAFEQAISHYRQALAIRPDFTAVHSNILFALNYAEHIEPGVMYAEARQWWQQQASQLANRFRFDQPPPAQGRRLRIGYVSPDFCRHSVSYFFLSVLKAYDRSAFEVFCYADVRVPDEMTAELQSLADHWRVILGLGDEAVARQIYQDRIDILVDLAGHTAYNRLLVFARKPAPIQVAWLGYPNTTGLTTMDYRLTDPVADPEGTTDRFYSETLIRLPHTFICYTPWQAAPAIMEPPALTSGRVTFGSFNNITKLSQGTIKVWAEILHQVPGSCLILKDTILSDPESKERFLGYFAGHGIDSARIILRERTESLEEHLALYQAVDIALDPFPYNGTTTTCEALWMGVPVISLAGSLHCSRVGASILSQVKAPELIAESEEAYIHKAVALARDRARLVSFRQNLREWMRASPLCDAAAFARDLETAYRTMWGHWAKETGPEEVGPRDAAQTKGGGEMSKHEREALVAKIKSFPFWYHKIALPGGITTPGWAPIDPAAYRIPADLTGKRVLDIGAWDGFWTFEALRRGAREVIAIDDFSDYLGELSKRDRKAWETFDLCKQSLGYGDDRCKRVEMTIYDLKEETFGHFDVIFFFGTLYHLRYPLLALDTLSAICDGEIFVESAILDDFSPYRGGLGKGYPQQMVMEFYPTREYGSNDSNWWAPSLLCLVKMMEAAGFVDCQGWKLTETPRELAHCRGFARGSKRGVGRQGVGESFSPVAVAPGNELAAPAVGQESTAATPAKTVDELNRLGDQCFQQGRLQEAEEYFGQAVALSPDSPLLLVNMGIVKNAAGRVGEAVEYFQQAIRLKPDFAEAHFNLANALLTLDLKEEAISFYQRAVGNKPEFRDAAYNLAATLSSVGRPREAIEILREAINRHPNDFRLLHLLGQAHHALGDCEAALRCCELAVTGSPELAAAHQNLGLMAYACGRLPEAVAALKKALALKPDDSTALNNLGLAYSDLRDFEKAVECYQGGLAIDPNLPVIHFNLGIALHNLGRSEAAVAAYRQALALKPNYPEAMLNLAQACRDLGREAEAEALYLQVIELAPQESAALFNLGILKLAQGNAPEAWSYCRQAVTLEPGNLLYRQQLVLCIQRLAPVWANQSLSDDIQQCLATDGVFREPLVAATIALLKQQPAFAVAMQALGNEQGLAAEIPGGRLEILRSPLLLLTLEKVICTDPELERVLTAVRKNLLLHPSQGEVGAAVAEERLAFTTALAHQCFANEYIYPETEEESQEVERLRAMIEQALATAGALSPDQVALLGCYRPLSRLSLARELGRRRESGLHGLARLLDRQVLQPLQEEQLRLEIQPLVAIDDEVSRHVRAQYEENPYPRWEDIPLLGTPVTLGMKLRQYFPFLGPNEVAVSSTPAILVAGCGTGREAIQTAHSFAGAEILAVDLSLASLAYAVRKARQYGISTIEFAQADILTLPGLQRQFDLIICSGVLHHMRDPLAGWRSLVGMLKPGGFMRVALYSELARQPIVEARAMVKSQGYDSSPEGIRQCRQAILALSPDQQMAKITKSRDFYTLSECRDLLFHVQEHRFTIPQLAEAIASLGLTFLGFTFEDSATLARYQASYPSDLRKNSWPNWQAFEEANPDTFLGMYRFWVRKR